MSQLSATRIFNALAALFSSLDQTDRDLVKTLMWQDQVTGYVTDGGTAGTAQTETAVWVNNTGVPVKVTDLHVVTPVNVTASDTVFATFTAAYRTAAGGGATTIGSALTKVTAGTGNLTAFAPIDIVPTGGNQVVPVGGVLTVAVAKASTGTAIASATAQAYIQFTIEPALT